MSNITIIGTGNMARTIGELAVAGSNNVEVMGRDQAKAANFPERPEHGALRPPRTPCSRRRPHFA
jgi:pyrroline-5-carboxylate reductase